MEAKFLNYIKNDSTFLEKEPLEKYKKKQLAAFKHFNFWQCMDTKRDKENLEKIINKVKFWKKKLLIAGGTGFIGYHLAKKAIERGYDVSSLSSKKPKSNRYVKKVKYIICNTLNKHLLKRKLNKNFDVIINLSGYVNHSDKKKTFQTHYYGCQNLANFF